MRTRMCCRSALYYACCSSNRRRVAPSLSLLRSPVLLRCGGLAVGAPSGGTRSSTNVLTRCPLGLYTAPGPGELLFRIGPAVFWKVLLSPDANVARIG